ncbi:MAG: hypothetical protein SXQ77_13805 [Halobacteria archaeon]|nr:hypothetical protein [Halobacteria archaeon]
MVIDHPPFSTYSDYDTGDEYEYPDEVKYITLTRTAESVRRSIVSTLEDETADELLDSTEIVDFSQEFLRRVPLPRSLKDDELGELKRVDMYDESDDDDRFTHPETHDEKFGFLDDIADYLSENAEGNLVVINSVTDLVTLSQFHHGWEEVYGFLLGLRKSSTKWDCVIYTVMDRVSDSVREYDEISSIPDGTMEFRLRRSGMNCKRELQVGSFRGALNKTETAIFETKVLSHGFEVSNIRKI